MWGSFTRGPAFPRLGALLDEFLQVFDTGSVAEASELHERIDRLGLLALDASGRAYHVSNVYFQEGGLLFNATPTAIG